MNSKLITPESPLLVPPLLASEIGWESAMILQQIHYFCDRSKHIRPDGRRWFWLTYEGWGQKIPFLKVTAIRRAIDKLRQLCLIDVFRHSQRTWYQANWYTVNTENVKALWLSICQKQQMEVSTTDISNCSLRANHIRDYSSKINSPQNTAAVGENLEVDWDTLENQVARWEEEQLTSEQLVVEEQATLVSKQEEPAQTTNTLFVDEQAEVDLSNEPIKREDNHSAVVCKVKTVTTSKEIESNKPSHGVLHVPETASPITSNTREDNTDKHYKGWLSLAGTMRQEEISEIRRELRQLRINPEACMSAVLRHWGNVNNALARVREAIADGWCKNPEGLFISSCKNGAKPQKSAVAVGFKEWFDWARKQRIALASTTMGDTHCVMLASDEWVATTKAMEMYPNKVNG